MPRIAIISDIHGNYEGLIRVFKDIEAKNCDRIFCLGDLVDGGPNDEAVVSEFARRGIPSVRGNHDENNSSKLPPQLQLYLNALPEQHVEDNVLFTHISPRTDGRSLLSPYEAWLVFEEFRYRLIFVGHLHIPFICGMKGTEPFTPKAYKIRYNAPFPLDAADRYIICVGAVGYSRDASERIRYGVYDAGANTIEIRSIEGPTIKSGVNPFDLF